MKLSSKRNGVVNFFLSWTKELKGCDDINEQKCRYVQMIRNDSQGRLILLNMKVHQKEIWLINLYGPNQDDPHFFENISTNLLNLQVWQYNFRPSPRPCLGLNQGPSAHINNWQPQSIITHRSTKATTLAGQGEQLLQVSERVTSPIEALLAHTTAN